MDDVEAFLEHYGVKGMQWGVRKSSDVSRKVDRMARKDAEEYARAKMYYGKGAGTRRKLIKATVEARSKNDPSYAKAFDRHLANQNFSTHASKAVRERKSTDRKEATKKATKATARRITNEQGSAAAVVALAALGVAYLRSPNGKKKLSQTTNAVKSSPQVKKGVAFAKTLLH